MSTLPKTKACIFTVLLINDGVMFTSDLKKFICSAQGYLDRINRDIHASYYGDVIKHHIDKGRISEEHLRGKDCNMRYQTWKKLCVLTDDGKRYVEHFKLKEEYRKGMILRKLDNI